MAHQPTAPPATQLPSLPVLRPPQVLQARPTPEPLEQRLLDLLQPFRNSASTPDDTQEEESNALILCENIAFLIRHRHSLAIRPDNISIAARNWTAQTEGTESAALGIFVSGVNGFTFAIMRVLVQPGESVVEKLTKAMDEMLLLFFPEV